MDFELEMARETKKQRMMVLVLLFMSVMGLIMTISIRDMSIADVRWTVFAFTVFALGFGFLVWTFMEDRQC